MDVKADADYIVLLAGPVEQTLARHAKFLACDL